MRNSIRFVYSRGRFEENKFCVVKSCYLSLSLSLVSVLDRYAIAAEHLDQKHFLVIINFRRRIIFGWWLVKNGI